jgi:hypothetical protein
MAVSVDEGLEGAPQFRRQIFLLDGVEERNGRLIGFELRHAPGACREVPLEVGVDAGWKPAFHVVGKKGDKISAAPRGLWVVGAHLDSLQSATW